MANDTFKQMQDGFNALRPEHNEIVVKTPEDLIALLRQARLSALREVREMVATITVRDGTTAMKIIQEIDSLITKESKP